MRIRPNERQFISDIFREEIDKASHRINERLSEFECRPAGTNGNRFDSVRRFYEELTDNSWTEADEETLKALEGVNESDVKKMMREAFQRSRIIPVPSFTYLMNLLKKGESEDNGASYSMINPDAISAVERERIANLLHSELVEASSAIASMLKLDDKKADIVREQLELVEGRIVGLFTPLV